MNQLNVFIVGGDRRTAYMAPCMEMQGFSVSCYGTSEVLPCKKCRKYASSLELGVNSADIIIGGIPFIKEGEIYAQKNRPDLSAEYFKSLLRRGQKIFAGVIPQDFREYCREKRVDCYDFMDQEPIAIFNAIATAEGAILEAMKNRETNLHGSETLVLGYGRCARILSHKLQGLDARVTVCCRREDALAYAHAEGMNTLPLSALPREVGRFEYICNTIPVRVFTADLLEKVKQDVLILDLASGKDSVDYEAAQIKEIAALHCPGLPGKYAAKVSAECLAEYVEKIVAQEFDMWKEWKI